MAATHGSIGAFDSSEEEWETYVERVEIYLAANKITDAQQKRDVLLSVCGTKTYHILRDLLAPTKPSDTSYADIVKCLKAQFNPKQGVAVHRYKFNSRVRQRGESVASFVAELRHLAIDCEFGDSLNEMLRDRLVCGVNDSRIQRRLLSEADLDFLKAALAMEMADRDAEDLQGDKKATTTEGGVFRAGVGEAVIKTVTGAVGNTRRRYANTRRLFVITVGRRGELVASELRLDQRLDHHRRHLETRCQ